MNEESLKKLVEKCQREHKIFCPYCEEEYRDEEHECISFVARVLIGIKNTLEGENR